MNDNWWGLKLNKSSNQTIFNSLVQLNKIFSYEIGQAYISSTLSTLPDLYGSKSFLCDDQWIEFKGNCFLPIDSSVDFETAQITCSSLNGALSSFSDILLSFISTFSYDLRQKKFWILNDIEKECKTLSLSTSDGMHFQISSQPCKIKNCSFVCEKKSSLKCNRQCIYPNGICMYPKCVCNDGWKGVNCEEFVCSNNCFDRGVCVGPNICKCRAGWTGKLC
jgi:hypothetical protein